MKPVRAPLKSALVDVDGTLVTGTTCERQLLTHLFTLGQLSLSVMSSFFLSCLTALLTGRLDAVRMNKFYWKGLNQKDMQVRIPELFEKRLAHRLSGTMVEELTRLRNEGFTIVLVSGTPLPLLQEIGKRLNVEVLVGTKLEVNSGSYTGRVDGLHPYGRRKLQALEEAGLLDTFDLENSTAYGDSWSDRFLLESVGVPVAVNPDYRLTSLARQRGWRMITD